MKRLSLFLAIFCLMLALGSTLFADTVQIGSGYTGTWFLPIYPWYTHSYSQQIYTQEQINRAGEIVALSFNTANDRYYNQEIWTIYLGHTQRSSFADSLDWEPWENLTQVFTGSVSSPYPRYTGWINIALNTHFEYDNSHNLVVCVRKQSLNPENIETYWRSFSSGDNTGMYYYSYTAPPSWQNPPPALAMTNQLAQVQLIFRDINPPLAPTLLSPDDGKLVLSNATLSWLHDYDAGGVCTYDLYLGTNPDPPLFARNIRAKSYSPPLERDSTYYWKVIAHNHVGASPPSATRSFTVERTEVIQVGTGTGECGAPFDVPYGYTRFTTLYTQQQTGTNRMITGLAWNSVREGWNNVPYKIWLKSTEEEALSPKSWDEQMANAVMVKEGTYSFNSGGWHYFFLDQAFYHISGNLLVGIQIDAGTIGWYYDEQPVGFYKTDCAEMRLQYWGRNWAPPVDEGSTKRYYPNILLLANEPCGNPRLMVNPGSAHFGYIHESENTSQDFTITNTGYGNLILSSISLSGNDSFSLSALPNLPLSLDTMQSTTFSLSFAPDHICDASGNIIIEREDTSQRATEILPISGKGARYKTIGGGNQRLGLPITPSQNYSYSQSIYLPSEINYPGQRIDKIAYYWNGYLHAVNSNRWKVYMGHTQKYHFESTTDWLPLSDLTEVYYGTLILPYIAGWITIELDTPFYYNNLDNLVIAVNEDFPGSSNSGCSFYSTDATIARSISITSNSSNLNPADPPIGSRRYGYPNIRLHFDDASPEPLCHVSPQKYDFDSVAIGSTKSIALGISNGGSGSLGITDISISGSSAIHLGQLPPFPVYLETGETISSQIIFSPSLPDTSLATITIYDDRGQQHTINLCGRGTADITVGSGDHSDRVPLDFSRNISFYQTIYPAAELTNFAGMITGIRLYSQFETTVYQRRIKIWLGSSTASDLAAGWIPANQLELVFEGRASFFAGENTVTINFPEPYLHTGDGNLVIMFKRMYENGAHNYNNRFKCQNGNHNRARLIGWYNDIYNDNDLPLSGLTGSYPQISFIVADAASESLGSLHGNVCKGYNLGIAGALISASNGTSTTTNSTGNYSLLLPVGEYSITVSHPDYRPLTQPDIVLAPNQTSVLNFLMVPSDNEDDVLLTRITQLKSNYPNPFNPETTIAYELCEATPVRLEIYNLKGQLVRRLVAETQAAGSYSIVFDGKDERNQPLASGIFFYHLSAGKYQKTRKMMLLK